MKVILLINGLVGGIMEFKNIKAIRRDYGIEVEVRKMSKDKMPDDGNEYYCDDEYGQIFSKDELDFKN